MTNTKILVLCTGNSCRSQMAQGWLNHFVELLKLDIEVYSAGVETHGLNPSAIKVMAEDGVDIAHHNSDHVDTYLNEGITHVITVCDHAAEACPIFPGKVIRTHQNFSDPSKINGSEEETLPHYRQTRNEIRKFSLSYLHEHFMQ